ncbi:MULTISPECIES: hypothetical protein [unclassified Microcoleus]|uniref:hypothetical protein n=1 Tax=unclassified Microcoleus TaxID=2642155 RepID=UPI002FD6DEC9
MTVGVWILGDRLWQNLAAINRTDDKSSLLGFPSAPPRQTSVRMSFILANLDKMPPAELATIGQKAAEWHLGSH